MKFRRRSTPDDVDPSLEADGDQGADAAADATVGEVGDVAGGSRPDGPFDVDDSPDDGLERIDLGSLLVAPFEGLELRLQVDEASGEVQSAMLAGEDGALEVRAFAAPRNGDLWTEVRPQIAADMAQRGGTATEREGRFGTELVCQLRVQLPDGEEGIQPSRIIGINGPRWLLRATLLGRPALEFDQVQWEAALTRVVVRRGQHALPVGEPLPLTLPEDAHRVGPA